MKFLKHELLVKIILLCSSLFSHLINAKKGEASDEGPDYYPRVNPNPSNIEELNVNDIDEYFSQFSRYYEIEYTDDEHEKKCHETFANNVKRIIILNKFNTISKLGINEFSHLTLDEFVDKYTGFNDSDLDSKDVKNFAYNTTNGAPPTLDWRLLGIDPVIRHQGPCKSSYVFSAIANIETQFAKNFKRMPTLSEQQAYDCEPTGNCKHGGLPHKVFESLMAVGGVQEQETYMYKPNDDRECKVNKSQMIVKVTNIIRLKPTFEDSLATLLALYGPLVTTIYVSESVKNYMKGILAPSDCDRPPNHAVLLLGYGKSVDGIPYWIIKNSWGHSWGEGGYMRLVRGSWACNIGEYVTTAFVEPIQKEEFLLRTNFTTDALNNSTTTLSTTLSNATKTETSTTTKAVTKTKTPITAKKLKNLPNKSPTNKDSSSDSSDASNFTPKTITAREVGTTIMGDLSPENRGKLRKDNDDPSSNDENQSSENSSTDKKKDKKSSENSSTENNKSSEEIKKIKTSSEEVKIKKKKKKKKLRTMRSSEEKPNVSSDEAREPLTGAIMDDFRQMRVKSDHEPSGEGKLVTSARKSSNGNKDLNSASLSGESDDRSSVLSSEEKISTIKSTNGYLDHV